MHAAEQPLIIPFHLFGFTNLINAWTLSVVVFIILFVLLHLAKTQHALVPTGVQNFVEMIIDFAQGLAEPLVGKHTSFFMPLFITLFFYIFFSNLMGLIPGLMSPTSRVDTNLGLALIVFLSTQFWGLRVKGMKYLAHFLPPKLPIPDKGPMKLLMWAIQIFMIPLMISIHLIGELARPLSLTMRLFGNIMAKEKLLAVLVLLITIFWPISPFTKFLSVGSFVLRSLIVVLGIFVSFAQALVFMLLAMVYIGGAVASHEEHDSHDEPVAVDHAKAV